MFTKKFQFGNYAEKAALENHKQRCFMEIYKKIQ